MEWKGYLHPDGKVRQTSTGSVGTVGLRVQYWNLARPLTTRTWVVTTHDGNKYEGDTRREAIARAMAAVNDNGEMIR